MNLFKLMQTSYNNFDETVRNYLSKVFDYVGANSSHSQVYNLIFDGIKGIMQNAMFYIEDALVEQNIYTASRKQSIYSLAKLSGYEPFYGSSASGTLIGNIIRGAALDSDATKIFIPNGAVIKNKETAKRYILELNSNEHVIDITKPLVSHEFKIVEGIQQQNYFTARGTSFETITITAGKSLFDTSLVNVYVNGKKFKSSACIYDMNEGENEYVISVGYDATFDIMFGDGIYGSKLNEGDSIYIEWIAHTGSAGNILGTSNTNFIFETAGRDTYGNDININKFVNLSMSNCISGGTDADTIETITKMIGYNSRSLVFATTENFQLYLKRFSFIGKVKCWSHENTMQIVVSCLSNKIAEVQNTNEYLSLTKSDLLLNNDQKEQILVSLRESNRLFGGLSLEFRDPIIWRYAVICIIKPENGYNKDSIKEELREIIGSYFISLDDNTEIIYKSDIIKTVMTKCLSILSFDLQFVSEKAEVAFKNNFYEKESLRYENGHLIPEKQKIYYNSSTTPGLDEFGNIVIESKLEIPILQGGFNYYDKSSIGGKLSPIKIETLQYVFI